MLPEGGLYALHVHILYFSTVIEYNSHAYDIDSLMKHAYKITEMFLHKCDGQYFLSIFHSLLSLTIATIRNYVFIRYKDYLYK